MGGRRRNVKGSTGAAQALGGVRDGAWTPQWHGKLVDNFIHESDVTSLKDSFLFYCCVPHKLCRDSSFKSMPNIPPFSRLLVLCSCSLRNRLKGYVSLWPQLPVCACSFPEPRRAQPPDTHHWPQSASLTKVPVLSSVQFITLKLPNSDKTKRRRGRL